MAFEMPNLYQGNYKVLIAIPLLLVAVSLYFIPAIKMGVDFKSGTLVTMQTDKPVDTKKLADALSAKGFVVRSAKSLQNPAGYEVEVEIEMDEKLAKAEELKNEFFLGIDELSRLEAEAARANNSPADEATKKYEEAKRRINGISNSIFAIAGMPQNAESANSTNALIASINSAYRKIMDEHSAKLSAVLSENVDYQNASFNEVSASLSAKFIEKAVNVAIYSVILVSILVFLIFRTAIPSIAVLVGAACDVIIALGAMGLFGIPLTLASFAALLMLVGFSLDTDVLLTMRVIKRKEKDPRSRAYEAMKTGMTMSMALFVSFACLFVLASITHINTYYEISSVALVGLVGDMIATWLLNAILVLNYAEKHSHGDTERGMLSSLFSG